MACKTGIFQNWCNNTRLTEEIKVLEAREIEAACELPVNKITH